MKKIIFILLLISSLTFADEIADLKAENAELKAELASLQSEVAQIQEFLKSINPPQAAQSSDCQKVQLDASQCVATNPAKPSVAMEENATVDLSEPQVDVYGFFRMDMAYDDSHSANYFDGAGAGWVNKEAVDDNDDQFNITGRVSRVGVKVETPQQDGLKISGVAEGDFCGGGSSSSGEFRMRHAYVKLDWVDYDFSILAGQYWDLISPIYPTTVDAAVKWWGGNLGYRRPQLRLTKGYEVGQDSRLELAGAFSRSDGWSDNLLSNVDSGIDSGTPNYQARIGLVAPIFGSRKTQIGISGHYGQEDVDSWDETMETWSVNIDFDQPITDWLSIKGEVFNGKNLDAYLGGIAQGVNKISHQEIASAGGWGCITIKPSKSWIFNTGLSIDDVDSSDINDGDRSCNKSIFTNCFYKIDKHTTTGFELQKMTTEYKGESDAENLKAQKMIMYPF